MNPAKDSLECRFASLKEYIPNNNKKSINKIFKNMYVCVFELNTLKYR